MNTVAATELTEPNSHLVEPKRWLHLAIGLIATGVSIWIGWINLDHGWHATDAGQLGQTAERVLRGELPHRDFDEMYTGGLTFLNALSFHWWGINSFSIRLMLFCWWIPFVVSVYWLACRFANPIAAGLVTILAAAWSIPMYSAPMPSWYNLFFATWALCAVIKFSDLNSRRYLLLAGLAIGLSVVFKISGLFVLAAILLYLLYQNQIRFSHEKSASRLLSSLVTIALMGASLLSLVFVDQRDRMMQSIHFVVPFLALTGFVIHNEWKFTSGMSLKRLRSLVFDIVPVAIGVSIPVAVIWFYYLQHNAVADWIHGTFVLPRQRIESASSPFPPLGKLIFVTPIVLLLFPAITKQWAKENLDRILFPISIVVAAILLVMQNTNVGFELPFQSFRNMGPFLILGNLVLLSFAGQHVSSLKKERLFLVTAVAFFVSLIQFPFAASIYFFYAAPLFVLCALATVDFQTVVPRKTLAVLVVFLVLLAVTRFHTFWPHNFLRSGPEMRPHVALITERCQFEVESESAAYNRIQEIVSTHTREGDMIFATPDAPEISFLTNRRPFSGVMYEFFHPGYYDDVEAIKTRMRENGVNLIVVKEMLQFSPPITEKFRAEGLAEFDLLETIDVEQQDGTSVPLFTIYKRRE